MNIKWIGHSCFLIESGDGLRVITDPFDTSVGYTPPEFEADIVLVSHQHFDHNNIEAVKGSPVVVQEEGEHEAGGLPITGIHSYHDKAGGKKRGENVIFKFMVDQVTLAHFGDLGHLLDQQHLSSLSDVEVAFMPVGGYYTIGPKEAAQIQNDLPQLKVIFPMHYKTDRLPEERFPLDKVDKFMAELSEATVRELKNSSCELTQDNMPKEKEIWILEPL